MEEFRDIKGFEGKYQISNQGRVKSLKRKVKVKGKGYRVQAERIRKLMNHRQGYKLVILSKNNIPHQFVVHRLVAEAFIPNPDNLPYVLHKNDIPDDNRVENLYWGNQQDNMLDRTDNGYSHSEETKKKISQALTEYWNG